MSARRSATRVEKPARQSSHHESPLDAWRRDFGVIYIDVRELAVQRYFYREVVRIATANPALEEVDPTLFEWIQRMHAYSASSAVRKQVDRRSDSLSLARLLAAIAPKAHLISRDDFLTRAEPSRSPNTPEGELEARILRQELSAMFDRLAGESAPHLPKASVLGDLARLDAASEAVARFVSETIAHRGRYGLTTPPTWDTLNAAIDTIEELVGRYAVLLDSGRASRLIPTWQSDWKAILRVPWLSPETEQAISSGSASDAQ